VLSAALGATRQAAFEAQAEQNPHGFFTAVRIRHVKERVYHFGSIIGRHLGCIKYSLCYGVSIIKYGIFFLGTSPNNFGDDVFLKATP
jgi:hypothetical protein